MTSFGIVGLWVRNFFKKDSFTLYDASQIDAVKYARSWQTTIQIFDHALNFMHCVKKNNFF